MKLKARMPKKMQAMAIGTLLTFSTLIAILFIQPLAAAAVPRFSDNLMDTAIITPMWSTHLLGSGTSITPTSDGIRIDFRVSSQAIPGETPGSQSAFGANLVSDCVLPSNFDIQVDYALINWTNNNGVRVGLVSTTSSNTFASYATERISDNDYGGEVYLTHYSDDVQGRIPTMDMNGTLRMTREGDTLTGYYLGPNGWVEIHSDPRAMAGDSHFGVAAWSHDADFARQDVTVMFRNFVINSGHISCENLSSPVSSVGSAASDFEPSIGGKELAPNNFTSSLMNGNNSSSALNSTKAAS